MAQFDLSLEQARSIASLQGNQDFRVFLEYTQGVKTAAIRGLVAAQNNEDMLRYQGVCRMCDKILGVVDSAVNAVASHTKSQAGGTGHTRQTDTVGGSTYV